MNSLTPTPEFMEALGRALEKNTMGLPYGAIQTEMRMMREGDASVRAGIEDEQAQYRAVARRYPRLYL
jgi:hypothetical protein